MRPVCSGVWSNAEVVHSYLAGEGGWVLEVLHGSLRKKALVGRNGARQAKEGV